MRFFRNASKKVVKRLEKKAYAILGGRAQKDVFPFMLKKKVEVESKKLKKIMIFDVLVPETKN